VLAAALTLLPAILGFTGRHLDRLRIPGTRHRPVRSARWARWSRAVQHRPVVAGLAGTALLIGLVLPVTSLRFGFPDAGSGQESLTSRRAYDLVDGSFGPGANGPLAITLSGRDAATTVDRVADTIAREPAVRVVTGVEVSAHGTAALLTVVPTTGPQSPATARLVDRLRGEVLPMATADADVVADVGGTTALFLDEARYEAARLPWFVATVVLLSFALLVSVFRSPLVALKAALLNLLGISAAYGVVAVAVQGGWLGDLIGIHEPTPVPVFVPVLMFAILFGLSMDYEVFLLSRIREEHLAGASNSDAVVEGIATTARVITAAAAIMVTVFGGFVLHDAAFLKMAGLGLAAAVFLDATVVRMVLVPASMELLGERNWWVPGMLDRLLPRVEVEPVRPRATPPPRGPITCPPLTGLHRRRDLHPAPPSLAGDPGLPLVPPARSGR
jgi:putative drug exporter of the RND superfamily